MGTYFDPFIKSFTIFSSNINGDRLNTVAVSTSTVALSFGNATLIFPAFSVDDDAAKSSRNSAIESRGFRSSPAGTDVSENSGLAGEEVVR